MRHTYSVESPHFLYSAKARFEYNAKVSALRGWDDPNGSHVSSPCLGDARPSFAEGLALLAEEKHLNTVILSEAKNLGSYIG
jgi:hypothetical protein